MSPQYPAGAATAAASGEAPRLRALPQAPLQMPPFRDLLKSPDVEDPINVYVHRPLAYAFASAVFRTPMTPNAVTALALVVGAAAGAMFLVGTPSAMVAGGILLWTSAILDGADGLLARAKNMQSEFGRALDGASDMLVALFTVVPVFYHIWLKGHDTVQLLAMGPALLLTLAHLSAYDYFKESFLRHTRLERGGEGSDPKQVAQLVHAAQSEGFLTHTAVKHVLLPFVTAQQKLITWLDPGTRREGRAYRSTAESAAVYRHLNTGPMRLWALVSLAPHSYLMAISAMADRLDIYLWIRLVLMNVLFVVAMYWQRHATQRTEAAFRAIGAIERSPLRRYSAGAASAATSRGGG